MGEHKNTANRPHGTAWRRPLKAPLRGPTCEESGIVRRGEKRRDDAIERKAEKKRARRSER